MKIHRVTPLGRAKLVICDTPKMTELVIEEVLHQDLNVLCRTCLKNDGTVSIFSERESEDEYTLQERIMSFAYVEIYEGDGLPSQICKTCLTQINNAFNLKAQCEYADLFLRQRLAIPNEETTEEADILVAEENLVEFVPEDIEELGAENIVEELVRDDEQVLSAEADVAELAANPPGLSDKATKPYSNNIQSSSKPKNSESGVKTFRIIVPSAKDISEDATDINCRIHTRTVETDNGFSGRKAIDNTILVNGVPLTFPNRNDKNDQVVLVSEAINVGKERAEIRSRKRSRLDSKMEVHKCPLCDKLYPLKGSLVNHIVKEHEPSGEFPCIECGRTFSHEILLVLHVKSHTAERPYCCSICGKRFMQLSTLTSHERSHKKKKSFLCNHCGKLFSSRKQHICPVVHVNREKTHQCNICGKKFIRPSTLTTHMKRHRLVERFRCKTCSKPFYSSQELERHTNVHLGVRPFACNIQECDHTFYTQGELNRHMRYHRGEKKHKCDQCGLAFYESGHLVNHKRKHTGERPYICEVCSKSFTDASKLKRHVNIHFDNSSRRASKRMVARTQLASNNDHSQFMKRSWVFLEGEKIELSTDTMNSEEEY